MKKVLFPCDVDSYDIVGSFMENGLVDYGTRLDLKEGDEVYIYAGGHIGAIILKCIVRSTLKYDETIDDKRFYIKNDKIAKKDKYVRLKPIKNYFKKLKDTDHTILTKKGIYGFNLQIELPSEAIIYLESL